MKDTGLRKSGRLKSLMLLGLLSFPLLTTALEITEHRLSNGIKLIMVPDEKATSTAVQVVYHVGGYAETRPLSGISHVLEHMMFQGTDQYPEDAFRRSIHKMGNFLNAFTADDLTAYFELVPTPYLPEVFALEADRLENLTLSDDTFRREIEVVKEERRMRVDDIPMRRLHERLLAAAFPSGPYHDPLVGWMDDLNQMTSEEVRAWYDRWYCADNVTIMLRGNFMPEQLSKVAEDTFGKARRCEASSKIMKEVPLLGPQTIEVVLPTGLPQGMLAYRLPSFATAAHQWEPFALAVAMDILDGGKSARFEKHIVSESQIASRIWAMYDPFSRYETLAIFGGMPLPEVSLERLVQAIEEQIADLKTQTVSEHELSLAKMRLRAAYWFEQDSPIEHLVQLAQFESSGLGWRAAEDYLDNLAAVTPEQVQNVMQKYFSSQQQIKGILRPEQEGPHA